jgi:hypothetical protein
MDAGSIGTWVGVGIGAMSLLVAIVVAMRKTQPSQINQKQKGTESSFNIQSGRDTSINPLSDDKSDDKQSKTGS